VIVRCCCLLGLLSSLVLACGGDGASEPPEPAAQVPPPAPLQTCSQVYTGDGGQPDVLVASDLPLQGVLATDGLQGTSAMRLVLEERKFRAGRFRVGYVSCDGVTPREVASPAKCRRSGRAYVAAERLLGVIGPFLSSCAIHMMAAFNRAELAQVGASNTYVGLTRGGPGIPPGQPERFRPSGRRNFVRLAAPDDLQGRAHAGLARGRGERSAYVLHDGVDAYSLGTANGFRDAAAAEGIDVVGFETWDPEARSYDALARKVARSGADGVFLGGYILSNAGPLIGALRDALPAGASLMATEAMLPMPVLRARAGEAADGLLLTLSSVANERLEGAGADFLARFRAETSQDPCCYTVHVAQAAHVLLDAIAASDGSRRSVTRELLRLRVRDGLIGDFSFDENGDVTPPTVSVYRIENGKQELLHVVQDV
jgi:branched-chain amino acid transport system substrate-binding protein